MRKSLESKGLSGTQERLFRRLCFFVWNFLVAGLFSLQGQVLWDGGGGNNRWNTGSNWSPNGVPGSGSDVVFDNSFVNPLPATIQLRGDRDASTLTFDTANDLSLVNGNGNNRTLSLHGGSVEQTASSSGAQSFDFDFLELITDTTFDINGSSGFSVSAEIIDDGPHSLTKTGSGVLTVSNDANEFTGLIVNAGTYEVNHSGNYTLGNSGTSYFGDSFITVDGATARLELNTTGTLSYNRDTTIDNGGTVSLTSTTGSTTQIPSLAGEFTFGSGGGVLELNGYARGTSLNVTTNADAASPAIVRYANNTISEGIYEGWTGGTGLEVNGGLSAGSSANVLKIELTNGALVEQSSGQLNFGGTLIISGVAGGDVQAASDSTEVGRWALDSGNTFTYDGGLQFENTVQYTVFNGSRTVDADITVLSGAEAGFQGRSTTSNVTNRLSIGASRNNRDLTVEDGGLVSFDVAWRTDGADNTGGLNVNARTVLEAGGAAQFVYTFVGTGLRDAIQVNGDIVGEGVTGSESTVYLMTDTARGNAGTTAGTTFFSDDVQLIVNSANLTCNNYAGLRLEGTAARVDGLADNARLATVSGTGGTLTLAYTDAGVRSIGAAANPASDIDVKLAFEGTGGGSATIDITGDLGNYAGIVAKQNSEVTLSAAQSDMSCGVHVDGGTLLLGADDVIGDSTAVILSGGSLETQGFSDAAGTLTLDEDSTIDLGSASSILQFADSSSQTWTGGEILQITNWSGNLNGGGTDQLLIGNTSSGVTGTQLSAIRFVDPAGLAPGTYEARILANGEIVPVPEPAALLAGLLLLGWCGLRRNRQRG